MAPLVCYANEYYKASMPSSLKNIFFPQQQDIKSIPESHLRIWKTSKTPRISFSSKSSKRILPSDYGLRNNRGNQPSDRKQRPNVFTVKIEKPECSYFLLVTRKNGDYKTNLFVANRTTVKFWNLRRASHLGEFVL